MILHRKST